jgi:hypothetical protein
MTDPSALETWRGALAAARPEVRAAAGRVAHVSNATALLPDLLTALAVETDRAAAAEMARALASLGDSSVDGALLDVARRLGGDMPLLVGDSLGRTRGPGALAHLKAFRELDGPGWGRRALVRAATRGGREALMAAATAALREQDPLAWEELLALSRGHLDPGLVVASLTAPSSRLRAATYWHLARARAEGQVMPPAVEEALRAAPEASGQASDLDARFGMELLGRTLGRAPREDLEWLAEVRRGEAFFPRGVTQLLRDRFTPGERRETEKWLLGSGSVEEEVNVIASGARERPDPRPELGLRIADAFPPGYATGLLDATGCRPPHGEWVVEVEAEFVRSGRLRRIGLPSEAPKGCAEAVRVLALSSLAPVGDVEIDASPSILLVPLSRERLACMEAESPAGPAAALHDPLPRARERVKEPRKTKDVKPRYSDAGLAGIVGEVEVEGTVGRTGCLRDMRKVRGSTLLAREQMVAMAQWIYTPTRIDGRPVPTSVSVRARFGVR